MMGERIVISLKCEPWIAEDGSVDDLVRLAERIGEFGCGASSLGPLLDQDHRACSDEGPDLDLLEGLVKNV